MARYLITASIVNSFKRIEEARRYVRESESDALCLEDKQDLASEKAMNEFILALKKVKTPQTEAMKKGIEYEADTYAGKTQWSETVEGGCYQAVGEKRLSVDGMDFLLYGRLDVLKGGWIYDIKRVGKYSAQKFARSAQHGFYLELFPEAKGFSYLIEDDAGKAHKETYYRDECKSAREEIRDFIGFLKANGLLSVYEENWKAKGD